MRKENKSSPLNNIDYFSTEYLEYNLKTRAVKGATVSVLTRFIIYAFHLITTIILARILTPQDFGLVTMAVTVGLLLGGFGPNGFTEAIVQAKEINTKQISTIFWINVLVSVLLAVIFVAFSFIIIWFFNEPRLNNVIIAIAVSNVFIGLSVQHLALLQRNMQFKEISYNELVASIIGGIIAVILALRGWGYWALVARWVVTPFMTTLGAWKICRWRPGLPSMVTGIWPMIKFSIYTYGNYVIRFCMRNTDKLLIGRYFGSLQLGYYDRGFHLANVLPSQIVAPLHSVAISTFSRLRNDRDNYIYKFINVISFLSLVGMPLSAIICLNSNDIVLFLLGPQWIKTGQIVFAMGLSLGITIIYVTHGWLHLSLGTPDRWVRWSILEFIVTVLCFMVGFSYGIFGFALAYSAAIYILLLPAFYYAGKPINLKFSHILSAIWKYYVSALAAGLCCWYIFYAYDSTSVIFKELNIMMRIIFSSILCLLVYLILIVVLYRGVSPLRKSISILREIVK